MARDLRTFIKLLEERGQLRRITALVDPDLGKRMQLLALGFKPNGGW